MGNFANIVFHKPCESFLFVRVLGNIYLCAGFIEIKDYIELNKKEKNMKKRMIFVGVMAVMAMGLNAQDKVVLRSGEELNVKIVQNGETSIQFQFPGEEMLNEKNKREIKYIVYASGRREECSQGIEVPVIKSKSDWKNVVITYLESDVVGLKRVGELKATSGWGGPLGSSMGYKGALNKLKKKAAKMGAGVILVHESPNKTAAAFGGGVQVVGTAYK